MRGYPKGRLSKQDFENLLAMPEYAEQAKADLARIAAIDDSMVTVDRGTIEKPDIKQIPNPKLLHVQLGFSDKASVLSILSKSSLSRGDASSCITAMK